MKTKEIQKLICIDEVLKGNLPCENIQAPLLWGEQDVLSILKSGFIVEYEVKISRSDFKADSKKDKWKAYKLNLKENIPNYFYYVCPEGLINEKEVPVFSGLIYAKKDSLTIIKKAKRIHSYKHDTLKLLTKFCRMKSERKYLGDCLMTYLNKKIIAKRIERQKGF